MTRNFDVKVRFISPYLQGRFSEDAQANLKVRAGTKAKIKDDNEWKLSIYEDKKGIYIPKEHFRESLVNGGKAIKKKPYGSFKEFVQSYFDVSPNMIFLGKKKPDFIKESFPARSDGMRVRKLHPGFNEGFEVEFKLAVRTEDIDDSTIRMILEKAGYEKGVGAWRAGGHGRYEVVRLEECK